MIRLAAVPLLVYSLAVPAANLSIALGGDVTSMDRIPRVPNSPSPFTTYTRQVTGKLVVDPWTIRLKSAAPYPQMPNDMSTVLIVSSRAAASATTDDFNNQHNLWAARRGITYEARADERTFAHEFRPQ